MCTSRLFSLERARAVITQRNDPYHGGYIGKQAELICLDLGQIRCQVRRCNWSCASTDAEPMPASNADIAMARTVNHAPEPAKPAPAAVLAPEPQTGGISEGTRSTRRSVAIGLASATGKPRQVDNAVARCALSLERNRRIRIQLSGKLCFCEIVLQIRNRLLVNMDPC
jgi:hypothetical protein